jgi:signal transduction histidine kinase
MPDHRRNWRALAVALGIMGLIAAMAVTRHHLQMVEHYPTGHEYLTWGHAMFQEAPHYVFWALAIPLIFVFADRVARRRWSVSRTVLAHAMFALVVVLLGIILRGFIYGLSDMGQTILARLPSQGFTYCAILGGVLAYHYARAYLEREAELANARLGSLRAQLRPHFMFNALNSVSMLVRAGRGPEAVDVIARVSTLLRDSLDEDDRAEVTLEEEVALARQYLAIEEVRFADRLQVKVNMSDQAKSVTVPRLILQPIVENAVRHGIGARAAAGRVEISARTTAQELIVVVRDDGPGPSFTPNTNGGVGLKNTRERLKAAYGGAARLTLEHAPDGGAVATLVIPL